MNMNKVFLIAVLVSVPILYVTSYSLFAYNEAITLIVVLVLFVLSYKIRDKEYPFSIGVWLLVGLVYAMGYFSLYYVVTLHGSVSFKYSVAIVLIISTITLEYYFQMVRRAFKPYSIVIFLLTSHFILFWGVLAPIVPTDCHPDLVELSQEWREYDGEVYVNVIDDWGQYPFEFTMVNEIITFDYLSNRTIQKACSVTPSKSWFCKRALLTASYTQLNRNNVTNVHFTFHEGHGKLQHVYGMQDPRTIEEYRKIGKIVREQWDSIPSGSLFVVLGDNNIHYEKGFGGLTPFVMLHYNGESDMMIVVVSSVKP